MQKFKLNYVHCLFKIIAFIFYFIVTISCNKDVDFYFNQSKTKYVNEIKINGNISESRGAKKYKTPGFPIRLTLKGTHYEMGLQYGVLLRDEIYGLKKYAKNLIGTFVEENNVSESFIINQIKPLTKKMYTNLPQRYQDEMCGIAEGSGLQLDAVILLAHFTKSIEYKRIHEIPPRANCATVFAKAQNNKIIHAWHQDDGNGKMQADNTLIINYNPDLFNSFIDIKTLMSLGNASAVNEHGLQFSGNTRVAGGYENGLNEDYFGRVIMEECSTLDDVEKVINKYPAMWATALNVSDSKTGEAAFFEVVPGEKNIWKKTVLKDSVLWDTNRFYSPELANNYENQIVTLSTYNIYRDETFKDLFKKNDLSYYTIEDIIKVMQTSTMEGTDEVLGAYEGICNVSTIKLIIFDSSHSGFYMGLNPSFASMSDIYYYSFDFENPPVLYRKKTNIPELYKQLGNIYSSILTEKERTKRLIDLTSLYPDQPYLKFLAGKNAWNSSEYNLWAKLILNANEESDDPEILVEAAMVYYSSGNYQKVISLLEGIEEKNISSLRYQVIRLDLLYGAYKKVGKKNEANSLYKKILSMQLNQKWENLIKKNIILNQLEKEINLKKF